MAIAWTTVPAPAPIRTLTVGVTEAGVAYVSFRGGERGVSAAARRIGARLVVDHRRTEPAAQQIGEYLAGERRRFGLPVDWSLTCGFQRRVLMTLHGTVGYGDTITYGELAACSGVVGADAESRVGGARGGSAAQRVGSVLGSNPIPVIVACHRVLAADGLGGFGGGLEVKRWLLALEGVLTPTLQFEAT